MEKIIKSFKSFGLFALILTLSIFGFSSKVARAESYVSSSDRGSGVESMSSNNDDITHIYSENVSRVDDMRNNDNSVSSIGESMHENGVEDSSEGISSDSFDGDEVMNSNGDIIDLDYSTDNTLNL